MNTVSRVRPKATKRRGHEDNRVVYAALIVAGVFSVFPLVAVLLGSFRPNSEIVSDPLGFPTSLDISNYVAAWSDSSLGYYFWNSIFVALGALALELVLALPLAYALGRWNFRGKALLSMLFLAGLMIPLRIGIVPLARLYDDIGLMDSHLGLILVYAAAGLPMAVLVLAAFYSQLPQSLEEAALVDGAGPFTIFLRIMTPLVRPAIAAVLVLNVGPAWNDFFMPLVLLRSRDLYTLPVGITSFFGEHLTDRGLLFAGIMIAIIPVIVFFAFAMKHVVRGLTAGIEK